MMRYPNIERIAIAKRNVRYIGLSASGREFRIVRVTWKAELPYWRARPTDGEPGEFNGWGLHDISNGLLAK